MTKAELQAAQTLLGSYQNAQAAADAIDPRRTRRRQSARHLDNIARSAGEGFTALTGKLPTHVEMWELSTENPAAWTKAVTNRDLLTGRES